jgi:hypothetical protein
MIGMLAPRKQVVKATIVPSFTEEEVALGGLRGAALETRIVTEHGTRMAANVLNLKSAPCVDNFLPTPTRPPHIFYPTSFTFVPRSRCRGLPGLRLRPG